MGEGDLSYRSVFIHDLPIIYDRDIGNEVSSKADQILTAKKENPEAEADTGKLETEIDWLVYELYGLSEEKIGIVEGSMG